MARIFVSHGHDHTARDAVRYWIAELGHDPVVLEPRTGATIIQELQRQSADVAFAIVVMTGDDVGGLRSETAGPDESRARQNVVFELGWFIQKLGLERVCVLLDDGVRLPTNYEGIYHLRLKDEWSPKLKAALERMGMRGAGPAPRPLDAIERTSLIVKDLGSLNPASSQVRFSGFLSPFAIGAREMATREPNLANQLLAEHDEMVRLARAGCEVRCIVSPPGARMLDVDGMEAATGRVVELLNFLRSDDPANDTIFWALSPRVERYLYIIDEVALYDGFKGGTGGGFDQSYRESDPRRILRETTIFDQRFDNAVKYTLEKFGRADPSPQRALRLAVTSCLETSKVFLENFRVAAASTWASETGSES